MPPAARITDLHTCPAMTGPVPHVGGPIIPPGSAPTVLINGLPAATVGTMATCVGPPDMIVTGSATVFINGMPAARMGDQTAHGGVIVLGSPNVIIGDAGSGASGSAGFGAIVSGAAATGTGLSSEIASKLSKHHHNHKQNLAQWRAKHKHAIEEALRNQHKLLEMRKAALAKWDKETRADVKKWFGSDDNATRNTLQTRVDREIALNEKMTIDNFRPADPPEPGTFAYVHPGDAQHTIYLDQAFQDAPQLGTTPKLEH